MTRIAMAILILAAFALAPGAARPSDDDTRSKGKGRKHEQEERTVSAARVQEIVGQMCVGCHGTDGNGATPVNPEYPTIAGLQREYLVKQMRDFRKGRRKSAIMETFAKTLSESEIDGLAAHFAAQVAKPGPQKPGGLPELGKKVYLEGSAANGLASCASCHLPDGLGTERFPRLAGQHGEYTYLQLKAFKSTDRDNDKGLAMQALMEKLTDQELRAVSEYIAGMGPR